MYFLIGFGLPLLVFGVIMFLGYRRSKKNVKPQAPKAWKNEFQGLDLNVWAHLGYQELQLDKTTFIIHLFCKREDHTVRAYRIQGTEYGKKLLEEHHTYLHKYTQPWSMGTSDLYTYIHSPSNYLKDYMAERYGHAWCNEKKWWVPSEQAKHSAAAKKQKSTAKKAPDVTAVEENVVQVNFGKKDES